MLPTMIVGSLPKPDWLAEPRVLRAPWKLEGDSLRHGHDDACIVAIHAQEQAGLDFVTDGEQRRQHYISHFCEGLHGFDYQRLVSQKTRGGKYDAQVPTIVDRVRWQRPVLRDDLAFTVRHASHPVKVTLPGPLTIADTASWAGVYTDEAELVMDLAAAVNEEALALAELGPEIIQIDEPAFNADPAKAREFGIQALDRALAGISCATCVHICYGYGTEVVLKWKSVNTSWGQYETLLPLLAQSKVDILSLEFAAPKLDPAVLELAGDKRIAFGCVDVSPAPAEPAEDIAERLEAAMRIIGPERLLPSTDCGMAPLDRDLAIAKMQSLTIGAALARADMRSSA